MAGPGSIPFHSFDRRSLCLCRDETALYPQDPLFGPITTPRSSLVAADGTIRGEGVVLPPAVRVVAVVQDGARHATDRVVDMIPVHVEITVSKCVRRLFTGVETSRHIMQQINSV